jgi:hypothetical protein
VTNSHSAKCFDNTKQRVVILVTHEEAPFYAPLNAVVERTVINPRLLAAGSSAIWAWSSWRGQLPA